MSYINVWRYARFEDGHRKAFQVENTYKEDGVQWYRLNCMYWFGDWIETQDPSQWEMYGAPYRGIYIVHEQIMTLIEVKWL